MIERFFTPGLDQVAYLIADKMAGEAAVIDPRRDVEVYTTYADARGLRIAAILETHVHADFVSGARELATATGAPIYASRLGEQAFPHEPLDDGDELEIGEIRLRAVWTPGHTPEHLSYLLIDPAHAPEPTALFSGDALFVGEVGRPDLLGEEETQRLAELLYRTVTGRLMRLDDAVVVYPGHTAGSARGKKIGDTPHTTIRQERLTNYAFQARSEDAFVRMVLAGMPQPPTYYLVLKRVNKAGPPLLAELPSGNALPAGQVATQQEAGAMVVDARCHATFGEGHLPDAVSAGIGPNFTTWMGWLAPYDRDLILVLDEDAQFDEARTELRRIGLDRVAGYLEGGMATWLASGRAVDSLPQMFVQELAERISEPPDGFAVLDVRSDEEWTGGHIPGAIHRYAGEIAQGASVPVESAEHTAVICGSGYRSSVAASLLQQRGYRNLVNVVGGMGAWQESKLPTVTE